MRGVKTRATGRWKRVVLFTTLLFIFGIFLNSVNNVYQKKKSAEELLTRMQGDIVDLKKRESFLAESLRRLSTVEGLKFEIRKKLNVAEVGESVAIIVAHDEDAAASVEDQSWWQRFKNIFR